MLAVYRGSEETSMNGLYTPRVTLISSSEYMMYLGYALNVDWLCAARLTEKATISGKSLQTAPEPPHFAEVLRNTQFRLDNIMPP